MLGSAVSGLARLDRVVKQQTIAAPHHPDPMLDQPARLVLARVVLKIFFRPAKAEQDLGNGAIALAAQFRVERAQGQDVPLAQLVWERAYGRAWRAPCQGAPQSSCRVDTQFQKAVQWQSHCVAG